MAPPDEIPRRAVPAYVAGFLGDRLDETQKVKTAAEQIPPGHRFLLYFHALADVGDKRWVPLKNTKRLALEAVSTVGKAAGQMLEALTNRQAQVFNGYGWERAAELYAPLLTGSGNPHPVENGFAFLSPYGVPYLAGSGIKGVLRRAAEELALLCEDSQGWTVPLVWALFGFDEKSAYLNQNGTEESESEWWEGYERFVQTVQTKPDPLLQKLLEIWLVPEELPENQAAFLMDLQQRKDVRRGIHFQGLLTFLDAFPRPGCQMAVDILNPHHKDYYQGSGEESPHDAESPVPVFFLVLEPGAKFVLRAIPTPGRPSLWNAVGDWRRLLDAAFDYASQWLGFGAKTSVGYGVLGPDRELAAQRRRQEQEEAERRQKEAEEEARRAAEEKQRLALEEEERRRREAEEAQRARLQAQWDALPEDEKIKRALQDAADIYLHLSEPERKKGREDLNRALNHAIDAASRLQEPSLRTSVAAFIESVYDQVGWADPGADKKRREKQAQKRRERVQTLKG
ncbi:type III-B CRISPR module RAMP protein Cmr6 [Desulfosoma sp.]